MLGIKIVKIHYNATNHCNFGKNEQGKASNQTSLGQRAVVQICKKQHQCIAQTFRTASMIALFAKFAGWLIQVGASCCSWIVASTCFYNEPLFALHTSAKHLPNAVFSSPAFWRLTSFPRTEEPSGAKITDLGQSCLTLPLHDSRH